MHAGILIGTFNRTFNITFAGDHRFTPHIHCMHGFPMNNLLN